MFSSISTWVVSITSIVCLSVLVELILPDGQMNKYIKGIFSFIIVFVIISPLPKLLDKQVNLNLFDYEESFQLDENYLYQINLDKLNASQGLLENEIQKKGYNNVRVYLNADIFQNELQIKSVSVDLRELVLSSNAEHNDISKIKKHISQIISKKIIIDEEKILYDQ